MVYIRHMIRTQVYLPDQLYQEIGLVAKREKKPRAQVIRETLNEGLGRKKSTRNGGTALLELAKLGKKLRIKGPKDLSTTIDKYLYEE